jgi:hypothetical protein
VRQPTIGTPVFILVSWLFSEKALLLVLVTVPLFTLALLRSLARPSSTRTQLLGLLLIPISLCAIASMLVAPILVGRVVGSSAIPLYLLIGPALIPMTWPHRLSWPRSLMDYALPGGFALVLVAFYPMYWGSDRIGRYPWDYNLDEFLNAYSPNDGMFHANLATYIVFKYYLPNVDQVVWKQANDLSQSLTNETKWAMVMDQARFEDVACNHRRWWIAFYENPTTSDKERGEIQRIVSQYHGEQVSTILKNKLVDVRIYLVSDPCTEARR